jgi:hypothetical protein
MWLDLMRRTNADPSALKQATAPKLKENLEKANATLDRIQKNLEDYLETKRAAFPRFFFLSNDELLESTIRPFEPTTLTPRLDPSLTPGDGHQQQASTQPSILHDILVAITSAAATATAQIFVALDYGRAPWITD